MEAAAARRVPRIRDLALEALGKEAAPVGPGHRGDERLAVRVSRHVPERPGRARLDHLPEVHHGHDVGDVTDDREVVRDEQEPDVELARQLRQQVRELGLRRRVERRERLVERDHRRVGRERSGDRDPLALSARELVREPVGGGVGQPDEIAELLHARTARRARALGDAVGELRADRAARVERRVRILEDELKADELRRPRPARERRHRLALEDGPCRRRRARARPRHARASTCRSRTRRQGRRSARARLSARARDRANARAAAPLVLDDDVSGARARLMRRRKGSTGQARRRAPTGTSGGHVDAARRRRRSAQRGWKAQPGGSGRGVGGAPAIADERLLVGRLRMRQRVEQRARVRVPRPLQHVLASGRTRRRGPRRRSRRRSAIDDSTPRSCVIRTTDELVLSPQPVEQAEDPGLDGHVERGRRLVGDQQLRPAGERDRDRDPLAHPARELVRVRVQRRAAGPGSGPRRAARPRARPRRCGRARGAAARAR